MPPYEDWPRCGCVETVFDAKLNPPSPSAPKFTAPRTEPETTAGPRILTVGEPVNEPSALPSFGHVPIDTKGTAMSPSSAWYVTLPLLTSVGPSSLNWMSLPIATDWVT